MRLASLASLLLILTACGGGGDGSSGGSEYSDIDAVAQAAKCDTFKPEEAMMFAAKTGTCTLPGGDYVTINWFNNDKARDQYVDVGTSNGAVYVLGSKWAIECETTDQQSELAKSTKGESKS